ncbi:glycosyltransferase family 4 protein [Hyphomicrobium sp. ghe19]|uniref:glycosyltransferase family 4 protein n=1 Tax=Hyphomicrobium sp. ghe19 TaxID=2682968 RepID=UPI001366AD24|nr:N-acetylgalactosamine-N, N'-diacetylbacillosaminyl-diphospho-undecaprenol 4-alpha-N-acetylgalactosaminyltransferase [Hyphomicrobium sp. ghe19]
MGLVLCRHWLSWGIRPVVLILHAEPAELAPDFAALGIDCITLDIPRTGRTRYFILVARVFALARKHRALGLLSMPFGWHAFIALGARLGGVRRVVAHVGNYPNIANRFAFAKFKILVQLGRPLTDRLVCCSRYVQRGATKHFGVRESETAVVYNGVPVEAFAAGTAPRPSDPAKPFTIGMVARLEKHKDQATLIRAAKILKNRGRNVQVKIVGDGSQRRVLEQMIKTEQLADLVSLLGTRRDVPAIIADLDLFVFSTTPDEGFGIALAEAMMGRVPIVASDVGACREVLGDGNLGLLVAPADPVALADAIDAVRADPQAANIRAIRAREKAMRQFSGQAMARAYGEFLGVSPLESPAASAHIGQTA